MPARTTADHDALAALGQQDRRQQTMRAGPARGEARILYQRGPFWVQAVRWQRSSGYVVWQDGATHARRVAVLGYPGAKGLELARAEVDRRVGELETPRSRP